MPDRMVNYSSSLSVYKYMLSRQYVDNERMYVYYNKRGVGLNSILLPFKMARAV